MSKKLNEEYKRFVKESAPDLWSRIEEALPEKEAAVPVIEAETGKKKPFFKIYGKFMPAAAAAVLLILIIPVAFRMGFGNTNEMSDMESVRAEEESGKSMDYVNNAVTDAMGEDGDSAIDTRPDMNSGAPQEAEPEDVLKDDSDVTKEVAAELADEADNLKLQEQGFYADFPFPEINQTVWKGGRLVSVEVSMQRFDVGGVDGNFHCCFEVPVLQEENEAAKKINQDFIKQYEAALEEYEKWREFCQEVEAEEGYYEWNTFLSYNKDGVINFGASLECWAGGVIDRSVRSYTYDLNTGKRLNLAEILGVKEEKLQETLLEGFIRSAKEEPDNVLWQVYTPQKLAVRLEDYAIEDFHYCIGAEGEVDIWFDKYELLDGAAGMQPITIGKVNYGQ